MSCDPKKRGNPVPFTYSLVQDTPESVTAFPDPKALEETLFAGAAGRC